MYVILLYTIGIIMVYHVSSHKFVIGNILLHNREETNLSWTSIFLFTLIFCCVNCIYTYSGNIEMSFDRTNYQYGYKVDQSPSVGLLFVFLLSQDLNLDFNGLSILVTALSLPLLFIAYRYANRANPNMLLLFLFTPYIINGFDNFKQTFTNGFACLLFSLLTLKPGILRECLCIGAIILACIFHPSGFILIAVYLIYILKIKIKNPLPLILSLLLITVILEPIMLFLSSKLSGFIPFLTDKIDQYFGDNSSMGEGRLIVALKGIGYIYITYQLIFYRSKLEKRIQNYNFNLIICVFVCCLYFMSYYNVWMPRMTELFFFPIMLTWSNAIQILRNKGYQTEITAILIGFFTYRLMFMTYTI